MNKKLLSTILIAALGAVGFASASSIQSLERQSCTVSQNVYDQVVTLQMTYSDQLAAQQYDAAQTTYDTMQSMLTTHCGNNDGIVSLQTQGQSAECVQQVNALLAQYNYMMSQGRDGIAAAIQQNIQNYLQTDTCSSLAATGGDADQLALNALLAVTIDQVPSAIPYSRNICFLDNTVDNFVEQVNNISEQNVLQSVDTIVSNLFNSSNGVVLSPDTQQKQSTILTYARGVIQDRWAAYFSNNTPSQSALFQQYLQGLTNTVNALFNSDGLSSLTNLVLNGPDLQAYSTALHGIYPSRNDFASMLDANPNVIYTWNAATQGFDMTAGQAGLQFAIPAATGATGTGATGDYMFTYRYYDGTSIPNPKGTGADILLPKRIIGDLYQGDTQQVAIDAQIAYKDAQHYTPSNIKIDLYANPYIINTNIDFTTLEDGNTQIDVTLQLYGPASCNFKIQFRYIVQGKPFGGDDNTDHPMQSRYATATVNNGVITRNQTDINLRDAAITAYEAASGIKDPIAAAAANAYFDADVFVGGQHIADINADDNLFRIKFDDVESGIGVDLLNNYILTQQLNATDMLMVISKISQLLEGKDAVPAAPKDPISSGTGSDTSTGSTDTGSTDTGSSTPTPPTTVLGCTDPVATNYDKKANKDDGSCTYPAADSGTNDSGNNTPVPVLGCMDPQATNYSPSATQDDGSCITQNPTDPTPPPADTPGCTDPAANNYNPAATQDNGTCTYDEVW